MKWIRREALAAVLWALLPADAVHAATVAVLDSGADPIPDLAPVLVPGYDFVDTDTDTVDDAGHGTSVSHIVWWSSGGSATILPLRVLDENGLGVRTDGVQALHFATADSSVRVINMSLGSPVYFAAEARALQEAVAAGKVVVMAAGNTSGGNPLFPAVHAGNLGGGAIAVGASDANGVIRPYSNRAGSAANAFMVAPDFPEANQAGTSFAAPVVSGAAAQVLARSPHLTGRQVAAILLSTARDMGKPGVDEVYGHGFLDLRAALMPVGNLQIATGTTVQAGGVPLSHGAMRVSPALGAALAGNAPALGGILVLDAYERGYAADVRGLIDAHRPGSRLGQRMAMLRRDYLGARRRLPGGITLDAAYLAPDTPALANPRLVPYAALSGHVDDVPPPQWSDVQLSFRHDGGAATWELALNGNPSSALATQAGYAAAAFGPAAQRLMGAPWLSFADRADLLTLATVGDGGAGPRLALASTDEPGRYGLDSRGLSLEFPLAAAGDAVRLSLQASALEEDGGLLGGAPGGAFAVDHARTLATTLKAAWHVGKDIDWLTALTMGYTRPGHADQSLLATSSTLRTVGFSTGLRVAGALRGGDALTVSLTSPLRVESGSARLRVPRSRDLPGNISATLEPVSLEPAGRELALEASWQSPLGDHAGLGAWLSARRHPDHDPAASTAVEALLAWETRF